ncbi:MAG: hypothetical protein D6756_05095 [Cyanobacteria bacterium J083]|nr:MAG: hypothetical protein D6756_05095 [Cyanobacteria bacterium J083]
MYISLRATFIRNITVALLNGTITLILLLIAPLGLATVITNTAMVSLASFLIASLIDGIILWLSYASVSKIPPGRANYHSLTRKKAEKSLNKRR